MNARKGRVWSGHTCTDALDGDSLWTVGGGRERLLGRVKRRVEESVNKCRLSEAGFALEGVSKKWE